MKPRERIYAALNHQKVDRIPRCEFWIDALIDELGQTGAQTPYANLGQDGILMPTQEMENTNAWNDGVDEWGRVWKQGMYVNGVVKKREQIRSFSVSTSRTEECFNINHIRKIQMQYPDHCLFYGSHIGPFMGAYMSMGFEDFFIKVIEEPSFVFELLEDRTRWAISMMQKAVSLGAEFLVLGDDAAHKTGPMISPKMWKQFILPFHKMIVDSVRCPIIFHSDGCLLPVIPLIIEAGFRGLHGLEPAAKMDLKELKREYGKDLVLVGNVDVAVLAGHELPAVRDEVDRCLRDGAPGGGYMLATCNSIFKGLTPACVKEYFDYSRQFDY